MKNLMNKIPWDKVAKGAGYGIAIAAAVVSAVVDHKKDIEFNEMKKFIDELKGEKL